jgi:paraquat-inducible protein A
MVEVFLLGVLVSLLKLGNLATLTLGTSFWAFVGLIVCLVSALAAIDHAELWEQLEAARP